jgi:hypothetical protein
MKLNAFFLVFLLNLVSSLEPTGIFLNLQLPSQVLEIISKEVEAISPFYSFLYITTWWKRDALRVCLDIEMKLNRFEMGDSKSKDMKYRVSIALPSMKEGHDPQFYRCHRGERFGEGWLEENEEDLYELDRPGVIASFSHVVVLAVAD